MLEFFNSLIEFIGQFVQDINIPKQTINNTIHNIKCNILVIRHLGQHDCITIMQTIYKVKGALLGPGVVYFFDI